MNGPKRVYIATDYAKKEEAEAVGKKLEQIGLELNARWIVSQPVYFDNGLGGELEGESADAAARVAHEDLEDICGSDIFVQLTSGEKARGGRHVELGFAISEAMRWPDKQVVAVGPREHAFHYHPLVTHLPETRDLWSWVEGYLAGARR